MSESPQVGRIVPLPDAHIRVDGTRESFVESVNNHAIKPVGISREKRCEQLIAERDAALKRAEEAEKERDNAKAITQTFRNFFEAVASTIPHMNGYKSTEAVAVEALLDWVNKAKDAEARAVAAEKAMVLVREEAKDARSLLKNAPTDDSPDTPFYELTQYRQSNDCNYHDSRAAVDAADALAKPEVKP